MLRAELAESMNKGRGGNRNPDGRKGKESKSENHTLIPAEESTPTDTLSEVAEQTGVSRSTVAADSRLMKALDKLGISRADYAAGKVQPRFGIDHVDMFSRCNMSTIPATAISESEALRMLNLPTSRRDWLRNQLPSVPMSTGNIYAKEEVTRLAGKLENVRRDPDAIQAAPNATLHTRIGSPARTR